MQLQLVTPPIGMPLTLDEVKANLRIIGNEDDAHLTGLIQAATDHVQNITNTQLLRATYRLTLDRLPSSVPLPRPPFATITSFKATDENGQEAVFEESYYTLTAADYTTVRGVLDSGWYASTYKNITIEYETGYETAADIPQPIKWAMHLIIADMYASREDHTDRFPKASMTYLNPYRVFNL